MLHDINNLKTEQDNDDDFGVAHLKKHQRSLLRNANMNLTTSVVTKV